jgi:DNA mismatch repair protein MutS
MRLMRQKAAQATKFYYRYQKEWWFLDAVEVYCSGLKSFLKDLNAADTRSRGFRGFRIYLADYIASERFAALAQELMQIKFELAQIQYCFLVNGSSVTVRNYESEANYSVEVEETFRKFAQVETKDYRMKFNESAEMDHVENSIIEFVAILNPDVFHKLESFWSIHQDYEDDIIKHFDREVHFYLSYLQFIDGLQRAGLPFCYPVVTCATKEVFSRAGFDLALAHKLVAEKSAVVPNDFHLSGKERVFIVSGPNQGGKTTFARAFGQLHYIASLGCPVPGSEARLFLFDKLFTHFEQEEKITDLRSKLEHDLIRLHDILQDATPDSIIVLNETFGSTTLKDSIFLGRQIMQRILALDALCIYVTFVTELASLSATIVSMVSTVVPDHPAARTFKVIRRPSDGRAYAISIAEKYRLTYESLKDRIAL